VSPDEQERRLRDRVDDGRKIWKLSPMDLKSYDRWDDCTKARDEMFAASDPGWAPWYVARPEEKKRARLNVIRHLLDHVPHRVAPAPKVKLPVDARVAHDLRALGPPPSRRAAFAAEPAPRPESTSAETRAPTSRAGP